MFSMLRCYSGELEDDLGAEISDASLAKWFYVVCDELQSAS